ncbi:hypothetical protein LTR37_011983 [Vermiconidia calcicola]|uniref:Uncharacterized protein n=1 Tax=Vermiconidia calcicola TaxID=1690605 RepID=A0ACC3N281_9PEZI|nr:hypothetical protein LTR37_011983 [Vermiconidia calcicola]
MAPVACFCGATFANVDLLSQHANSQGHRFMCSCGVKFATYMSIVRHQSVVKHGAAVGYTELPALKGYTTPSATDKKHESTECPFCPNKKPFKTNPALLQHIVDSHPTCPSCNQTFQDKRELSAFHQLRGHQKAANHTYCAEHDLAFDTDWKFVAHKRATVHITGFECIDCGRDFSTQRGLDDHLNACPAKTKQTITEEERAAAALAKAEEANLRCEPCDRKFKDLNGFRMHKASIKHNPLSEIKCFLSATCTQTFTSPSAWLFHLESGKCKSGMDRKKLYAVVHANDADRHITSNENTKAIISIAASDYGNQISPRAVTRRALADLERGLERVSTSSSSASGFVLTPEDSETYTGTTSNGFPIHTPDDSDAASVVSSLGGVDIATPTASTSRSTTSTDNGVKLNLRTRSHSTSGWDYVTNARVCTPTATSVAGSSTATITYDTINKAWPCMICNKTFKTKHRLLMHLDSPAHAPKLFHCPPAAVLGISGGKPEKKFKTLSGLAQHVETGACNGGMELLKEVAGIFERRVKLATGSDVKLLRAA